MGRDRALARWVGAPSLKGIFEAGQILPRVETQIQSIPRFEYYECLQAVRHGIRLGIPIGQLLTWLSGFGHNQGCSLRLLMEFGSQKVTGWCSFRQPEILAAVGCWQGDEDVTAIRCKRIHHC